MYSQLVLGRLLVLVELLFPFGRIPRRDNTSDGAPFDNAETGLGEAGNATDHDDDGNNLVLPFSRPT